MGSLGEREPFTVSQLSYGVDAYEAEAADNMKHMVMAMIAIALVFATLIGLLVMSGIVHDVSTMVCAAVDLPSPVQLS
ncbi:MAG: hypothetical protein ACKOXK_11480 [Chakrabartia sp.]